MGGHSARGRDGWVALSSSEPPGLSLRLEEGEDVPLAHGALHVADDGAVLLADELHLDLGALALGARAAEDLGHARQGHLLVHGERGWWGMPEGEDLE